MGDRRASGWFTIRRGGGLAAVVVVAASVVAVEHAIAQPAPRQPSAAATARGTDGAIAEVRAASRAYLDALNRGDGAALARMWTTDGDIIDEAGVVRNGRQSVAAIEPPAEDAPPAGLTISDVSIRLLAPTVAIEDGAVEVPSASGGAPNRGRFTATWVRQEDGWKLAGVRENRVDGDDAHDEMRQLEWMVGEWEAFDAVAPQAAAADGARPGRGAPRFRIAVRWSPGRAFLIRELRTAAHAVDAVPAPDRAPPDAPDLVVTQFIGWDPAARQIRSWTFGEDGSHGEGVWNWEDDAWFVKTVSVLPDGSQSTSVNVYRFNGDDSCSWQSLPTGAGDHGTAPVTAVLVRKNPHGTTNTQSQSRGE